jgi:phosphoribosyl isomerase A
VSRPLELLAAVDVAGRRATQVVDGGTDDPRQVARRWVEQGAGWVHLVDLDRAYRRGSDLPYLAALVAELPVPVQLSGGLDTPGAAAEALATGARRVNLAVTALRDPTWVADLVREHGDRVAVGIDVAGDQVVARGSRESLGSLDAVLDAVGQHLGEVPPGAFVVADATRDGRLSGADPQLFRTMVDRLPAPVVASGGVAGIADLLALRDAGVVGIVLGAALHHGRFTLSDALEALR